LTSHLVLHALGFSEVGEGQTGIGDKYDIGHGLLSKVTVTGARQGVLAFLLLH
jgi:hypothetical protein